MDMREGVVIMPIDPLVGRYIDVLCRGMDEGVLMGSLSGCMCISDRQSVYEDYLQLIGSRVLRSYSLYIDRRDRSSGIYYYDGRLWCPVDGVMMRKALKVLCTKRLYMSSSEWIKGEKRYIDALYDGAMMSPLVIRKSLVGFKNGVYDFSDLGNIVYYPYGSGMDVISSLPYDYSLDACCPLWESFLGKVLDSEQRLLLQKFMSLGLVDRSSLRFKVENCLWMVGPGGAGKSTIANVISYVYGEENVSGLSLGQLLSGGNDERSRFMALLSGKVFNFCKEIQMNDITYHVDLFKSLCSGEVQQMRRIGGDVKELKEIPYFVFNMNRKPRSRTIDSALMRRLLFLTFRQVPSVEDVDTELESKLKLEAAGIRNWLIEGFRQLERDGFKFTSSQKSIEESDEWHVQNGRTLELFLRKMDCRHYSYIGKREQCKWIPVKVIYGLYSQWCEKNAYDEDVTSSSIGHALREIGFEAKRTGTGVSYKVFGGDKLL